MLRTADGKPAPLYTEDEGKEVITAAARQKNRASNASNLLHIEAEKIRRRIVDPKGGLTGTPTDAEIAAAQDAALVEYQAFAANIEKHAKTALAAADALDTKLPEGDVPRLQRTLRSRLAGAANRARNTVLDSDPASQAALLDGACVEERRALEDIAVILRGANQNLREATTEAAVKEAYDTAVRLMAVVPVTNAPLWLDTDGDPLVPGLDGFYDVPIDRSGTTPAVSFRCLIQNPPPEDLKNKRKAKELGVPYAYPDRGARGWVIDTGVADKDNNQRRTITIRWAGRSAVKVGATAPLIARNRCGPAVFKLRVVEPPPAETPTGD